MEMGKFKSKTYCVFECVAVNDGLTEPNISNLLCDSLGHQHNRSQHD
jgi:hypothetical protein